MLLYHFPRHIQLCLFTLTQSHLLISQVAQPRAGATYCPTATFRNSQVKSNNIIMNESIDPDYFQQLQLLPPHLHRHYHALFSFLNPSLSLVIRLSKANSSYSVCAWDDCVMHDASPAHGHEDLLYVAIQSIYCNHLPAACSHCKCSESVASSYMHSTHVKKNVHI